MCTVDGLRSVRPVNFSKSMHHVDALKPVCFVNFNKIVCTVNSNKPGCPVNSSTLVRPVNSSNFVHIIDIRSVDSNKPLRPVNSSKPVRSVDARKPIHPVNSNKIVHTVNSNQPVNSEIIRPVNSSKPVHHGNSRKPVCPIDVHKSVRPVNSNKPVCPVDVCKSIGPADVCKSVYLVDIPKPFFVVYWRNVILFLILLFFVVSIITSVINKTILYMIIFIDIHMIHLIFTSFFECKFVILIGYFLYIGDRLLKYFRDFHYFQVFFKLFLIIFVMNFAFVNIFYLNIVSFGVNNVKAINGIYSLMIMAEDFSNYGQEVFISVSVTSENTTSLDYILWNYLILKLISFCAGIFGKNRILSFSKLFASIFIIFLCFCKAPKNLIDFDLKTCSKFEFYSSESIKLQENLT